MAAESVLLFGAAGQVGSVLAAALREFGPVVVLSRDEANLDDAPAVAALVDRHAPALVVNAAAYTRVDDAERDRDGAFRVNAEAPAAIAAACGRRNAVMVHFSTDYVYDGTAAGAYLESAPTAPLSVYGASKLAGDLAVAGAAPRHLIFRTSWVYGDAGRNFLRTMLNLAAQRESLRLVNDQTGAPTSARLIASTCVAAIRQVMHATAGDARWGVYHLAAAGATTWHEYGAFAIETARALGWPCKVAPGAITGLTAAEYGAAAPRPANSRLDTGKLRRTFGVELPDWRVDVAATVERMVREHKTGGGNQ